MGEGLFFMVALMSYLENKGLLDRKEFRDHVHLYLEQDLAMPDEQKERCRQMADMLANIWNPRVVD